MSGPQVHAQEEQEARTTTYIDGYGLVDSDTGELVEMDDIIPALASPDPQEFDDADVEWALKKLFAIDGDLVATETRLKAELAAITSNLKPKVNRLRGAKESFKAWVGPQLQAYAERRLAKENLKSDGTPKANPARSIKNPFGVLAFTAVNKVGIAAPDGGVAEQKAAVQWMKENMPGGYSYAPVLALDALDEAERSTIEAVASGARTWEEVGWSGPCPLKVTLPGDRFDFRTGVK